MRSSRSLSRVRRWFRTFDLVIVNAPDYGIYEPFEPPELGQTVRLEAPRGPLEMEGAEMVGNYRRAKARLEGR